MSYFLFIVILFLVSCFQSNEKEKNEANQRLVTLRVKNGNRLALSKEDQLLNNFLPIWKEFTSALAEKDTACLNKFIHPANGMYVLFSKGAMPGMINTMSFPENNLPGEKTIPERTGNIVECELKNEELPVINCDSVGFYNKKGCFIQCQNRLDESKILDFLTLSQEENKKAMEMMHAITLTVVNTQNFVYYFSYINNKWFLTFLDMRRPCEA